MLATLKLGAKSALRRLGYDLTRRQADLPGRDPMEDMHRFTKNIPRPVVFDVGANVGQTVEKIKACLPLAEIHSFEPSPATFELLRNNSARFRGVHLWNYGVGASNAKLPFHENTHSDMSSFLEMTDLGWGQSMGTTLVEVVTLDEFCAKHGLTGIHILKSDTQGYDFEVLKGAAGLMARNQINLIFFEVMFSEMYRGSASFDQIFRFLLDHNFALVTFYGFHFQQGRASWTDALFINNEFHRAWQARQLEGHS